MNNIAGWAVQVSGDRFDLDSLAIQLSAPGDPWVETYSKQPNDLLLRSNAWASLTEARDVFYAARDLITQINGALPLTTMDVRPLKVGGVFRFKDDGTAGIFMIAESTCMIVTMGRVHMSVNGELKPRIIGDLRGWLKAASGDVRRAELLAYLSEASDWYSLYKGAEKTREIAGGETELKKRLEETGGWKKWKATWQTINHHRHAKSPNYPPAVDGPSSIGEAKASVQEVAFLVL